MRCLQDPLPCHGTLSWTFSGLIAAFVDLAIAYLLLCASAVAFFASKFLNFLGLSLPCPCNGVFIYPNRNLCLENLLIDGPVKRVSSVQLSVKHKFPFGSNWERDQNYQLDVKLVKDRDYSANGLVEMEGEASSNMGRRSVINSDLDLKEEKFDLKGKGNVNQRPRIGIRRRRKVNDNGKVLSVLENRSSCSDGRSPYGFNEKGFEGFESGSEPVDFAIGFNQVQDGVDEFPENMEKSSSPGLELESVDENNAAARNTSSSEGVKSDSQIELILNDNEKHEVKILEQALEQEHAARSALYLELEKERSAAASAADEAMAMILRLQEEKASVEMEAHQFQRMIEEKSTYDAEEMNILKEIIVRRETEKHFLEKEVEAYRAMVCGGNTNGELAYDSAAYLGEDNPDLMLQQLSEWTDNHEAIKGKISINEVASSSERDYRFADKMITISGEQLVEDDVAFEQKGMTVSSEIPDIIDVTFDVETPVHDVHVIENRFDISKGAKGEKIKTQVDTDNSNVIGTSRVKTEPIRGRSNSSDLIIGLPPLGGPGRRSNSMSEVDNEMVKIDSEVGWLRERLRIVQEGREKLNFSMERQERELFQVQLLEDIACQLKEIRQLTSPTKAARQASLPHLPPKVMSKKRRYRNVSGGVNKI